MNDKTLPFPALVPREKRDENTPLLELVVIYDHPRDYPDHFVVRPQGVFRDGSVRPAHDVWTFSALRLAQVFVVENWPWLICVPRHPDDDPAIVEVYL